MPPSVRAAAPSPTSPGHRRYQLLHTAGRIVRGQRKVWIKIDTSWPWARQLTDAFDRLAAIRQPLLT
jgi:hypothetical protein